MYKENDKINSINSLWGEMLTHRWEEYQGWAGYGIAVHIPKQ